MKTFILSAQRKVSLMLLAVLVTAISYGAAFTATSSGNFSSTSTWAGGVVPPSTITTDQITIQSGVIVNLDNNLTINGVLAQLDVEGTLNTSNSSSLTLTLGSLTGAGAIVLNTVNVTAGTTFSFTGSLTANTLNAAAGFQSTADIMVNQTLNLASGTLTLATGGSLTMGNSGTIVVSGGLLTVGIGGSVVLTGNYNVTYTNSSAIAGVELSGTGLQNVTVNVGSGNSVTLTTDLTVGGTLTLTNGTLTLGGNDLTINGNIAASGIGTVASTSSSNITIATSATPSGSLTFSSSANTLGNLTINVGGSGSASINSALTINGTLAFTAGTLNIMGNALVIGSSGSVTGAGNFSYVITAGGYVEMHVTAGASGSTSFPIGTSAHFAPADIFLNTGSSSGQVQVGVVPNVLAQGTAGADISATQPLVDATWNVHSDITSNLNLTLKVLWSTAMEVNSFNHAAAYISHYTGGSWDMNATATATAEAGGMYSLQKTGITSLSPFAVFDQNTSTGMAELANAVKFEVYPNPVTDNLIIQNTAASVEPVNMDIYSATGQMIINNYKLSSTTTSFPVKEFQKGTYLIKFYNNKLSSTKSFIKM